MALLLLRFGIVFTIGIFLIAGPISAYAFNVTLKGPGPRIKFILEPPSTGIVSKNFPLLLPCFANVTINFTELSHHEDDEDDSDHNGNPHSSDTRTHQQYDHYSNNYNNKHFDDDGEDDYDDDDDQESNEDFDQELRHRPKRNLKPSRRKELKQATIKYTWYRNGENLSESHFNGFRSFANGTLKIQYGDNAAGEYRCLATDMDTGAGSIISKKCKVSLAAFERLNYNNATINATNGYPLVINCMVTSNPPANISWFFNKNELDFDLMNSQLEKRYHKLQNGSLLITKITGNDGGKYKCVAVNSYFPKSQRNYVATVAVVPLDPEQRKFGLLEPLQSTTQKIRKGATLNLFCIGYSEEVYWTYSSRFNTDAKKLLNKSYELKIMNVTELNNDGFYTCHLGNVTQIFDVIIISPPKFTVHLDSYNSSVAATASFKCAAIGSPPPNITWYRNGVSIDNHYRFNYESPVLKIVTLEEEDEGVYQCFASNDAGEDYESGYFFIRRQDTIHDEPRNVVCYPINISAVKIEYESNKNINLINYILISKSPYKTIQSFEENFTNCSFQIGKTLEPLKPYQLYLRAFIHNADDYDKNLTHKFLGLTHLSFPVICATQGLIVQSKIYQNGIYLFWQTKNLPELKIIVLQFYQNNISDQMIYIKNVIVTQIPIEEPISFEEIQNSLVKINADIEINRKNQSIIDIRLPGNVTGILIPNVNKISVRVLGSIGEELLEQDLRALEFTDFTGPTTNDSLNFHIIGTEARSITLGWNNYALSDKYECISICYKIKDMEIHLKPEQISGCLNINKDASELIVNGLQPTSLYRFYMQKCDRKESFGSTLDVRTNTDVPGPVEKHSISKNGGITLNWERPINVHGELLHYSIEWFKDGQNFSENVNNTVTAFKFPNITSTDKINITIRAVSTAGKGIPIYVDLSKLGDSEIYPEVTHADPTLGIAIGVMISVLFICICVFCIIKDRTCKKQTRNNNLNRFSPIEPGANAIQCQTNLHEMQSLINKNETTVQIPNGHNKPKTEGTTSKNINNYDESTNVLGPIINDVQNSIYIEKLPPAPDDIESSCNSSEPLNGIEKINLNGCTSQTHPNGNSYIALPNGSIKNLPLTSHSISTSPSIKSNGNLKITDNPQYLNNSTFTLDNSQHKLLETTLDKISNIDDDIDIDIDTELNESNLSTKPLQSSWNYRRPIVGPNG